MELSGNINNIHKKITEELKLNLRIFMMYIQYMLFVQIVQNSSSS